MAGEFGQFRPADRKLSDVTSVQAPVQDVSSASALGGVAQGLANLGQVAITAFKVAGETEEKQKKLEQEKAIVQQKAAFEQDLLKAKDMAEQQGSTSIAFKTYLTQSFDKSPLDLETKAKMMKDFQATALGKPLTELSPEERAFQKVREEAGASLYYTEFSTEEEIEQGIANYVAAQRQAEADAAELRRVNREQSKLDLTQDQRLELEKEFETKQMGALSNLAANYRTPAKNQIGSIIGRLQKGEVTHKEAQESIRMAKGELEAVISQTSRNVKDRALVENLSKPLLDLYDFAINNADSENILEQLKTQNAIVVEQVKFNQLSNDPKLAELMATSSMFGHNNPALFATVTPTVARLVRKNSETETKPADVTEETQENKTYLNLLSNSIDRLGVLKADGSPEIDQQELLININNTILGSNRYIDPEDPPTQNKQMLQWLAQPKVGEYIKGNLSKITPQARVKLTDTLFKNAENYVYPRVVELTNSLFTETKQPKRAIARSNIGVTEAEVEMLEEGNAVVFRGSTPEGQRVADTMNREVSGALTTYFNATANLTDETFSSIFKREKQVIWPSKYGEPTEDGTYVDEVTGEEFTIVDGKRQ